MAPTWDSGPVPFPDDTRWRWRAVGYLVDGDVWPYRLEVRFKGHPCHHDTMPSDWDESGALVWEPTRCDCWDDLPERPALDTMPPGGLSARLLRQVRLGEVREGFVRSTQNLKRYGVTKPAGTVWDVLTAEGERAEQNAQRSRFAERGPGRPSLPRDEHLRRLAVLVDEYAKGHTQRSAARRLRISEPTLRQSLEWARREDLWTPAVNGRRGEPTDSGRAALADWQDRKGRARR
ncbi:MAG: hypothetical protein U0R68_13435 [Candidatus Nanopelagicales bacterium]